MLDYSRDCFEYLCGEFLRDCPMLRDILHTFSSCNCSMNTDEMKDQISKIPSIGSIVIRSKQIHSNKPDELIDLWSFIHETGFIDPCVRDDRQQKQFRHITFREDPYFVSINNVQKLGDVLWDIHPAYRSYLQKRKEDETAKKKVSLVDFFSSRKKK